MKQVWLVSIKAFNEWKKACMFKVVYKPTSVVIHQKRAREREREKERERERTAGRKGILWEIERDGKGRGILRRTRVVKSGERGTCREASERWTEGGERRRIRRMAAWAHFLFSSLLLSFHSFISTYRQAHCAREDSWPWQHSNQIKSNQIKFYLSHTHG